MNFQQRIEKLHDHLYANANFRTPSALAREIGKVLHTAFFIERENGGLPAFSFDFSDLHALERGDSEIASLVYTETASSFARMNAEWRLYSADEGLSLTSADTAFVVAGLSNLLLSDAKHDYFGDALEIFRSTWAKRAGGQFFTDQQVTRLAVDLLEFDPRLGDDLVDICAGTGGFLLAGLNRIRRLLEDDGNHSAEAEITALARNSLVGFEVDPDVASIADAALIARLSDVAAKGSITIADSLRIDKDGRLGEGKFSCIATNPPFGTKITVKDRTVLKNYELSRSHGRIVPRAPDVLFMERNVKLLKKGRGRAAIVTPFQIMSGPQASYVREWLLRHAEIKAVVDLPADTFQPHTGTKASLLVVQRREVPLDDPRAAVDTDVFMSVPKWIGHDRRGKTVFRKDGSGRPSDDILTDLPEVGIAFAAFQSGKDPAAVHDGSFVLPLSKILETSELRLNASFYVAGAPRKSSFSPSGARLGDVISKAFIPGRFKRNYVDPSDEAVPFLGGANITELVVNTHKWVSRGDPRYKELAIEQGWILLTRSGSTGIVSSVPPSWHGYAMSEHVIRLVPDADKMSGEMIQALLRSSYGQEYLRRGIFGSVIDEISIEYVLDMPLPALDVDAVTNVSNNVRLYEEHRELAIRTLQQAATALSYSLD